MKNLEIIQKFGLFPIIPIREDKKAAVKWSNKDNWAYSEEDYQGKYPKYTQASAIITGEASGVMVVDLDNKNGENGIEVFKEILSTLSEEAQKTIKDTLTIKSPNSGLHLYFKYREGLRNTAGVLPGIDIRTTGGIIIAPGSKIKKKDGTIGEYKVARGKVINEMPDELFTVLKEKLKKKDNKPGRVTTTQYQEAEEGSRNQTLFKYLCKMIRTIKNGQELVAQANMYNTTYFNPPLSQEEVEDTVNSVMKYVNQSDLKTDDYGIYKTIVRKTDDGEEYVSVHLTDFIVKDAKIIRNLDTDEQIIEMVVSDYFKNTNTITADARTLFNEIKNIRTALGIDYNFTGTRVEDLIKLKKYIVTNCVSEDKVSYQKTGIRKINDQYVLVTNAGILYPNGEWNTTIAADNVFHDIDFAGIEDLTKEEAEELAQHLLTFNSDTVVYNTLGAGLVQMLNSFVRDSKKDNLPVLFNIGESNAGKSKAQHILKLLFNNTKGALGFNVITPFTLQKAMGDTYLPLFVDEIKPSKDGGNKKMLLSRIVRSATEGYTNFKGTQSQKLNQYETNACLILTGEDGTDETAVVNRTNTVRYSRMNFTETGEKSIEYLCSSSRGEELLRKLSKQLYLYVLNNYDPQVIEVKYDVIKNNPDYPLGKIVDDRIRKTAIYTIMGLELLNDTFTKLGVDLLMFGFTLDMVAEAVVDNLIEEVNDGGETALAEYEKILLDIDHLAGNVDIAIRLREGTDYKVTEDGNVAIIMPAIWDKLEKYYKSYKTGNIPLDKGTFTKTLRNSKYFKDYKSVTFKDYEEAVDGSKHARWKSKRAYVINGATLGTLEVENLIEVDTKKDGKIIEVDFADNPF